jgi:hypothetical protein
MSRTRIYTAFDGDSDMVYYRTLQMWSANSYISFDFNNAHDLNYARDDSLPQSIINQLRERLDISKSVILLVGDKTKHNRKGILKYELNYSLKNQLPILLSFVGFDGSENNNSDLWNRELLPRIPTVINAEEDKYCLISPFNKVSIEYFVRNHSNNNLPKKGYSWLWQQ